MQSSSSNTDNSNPNALASFLKASADSLRLMILRVLAQDSYGVLELATLFEVTQSGMSHHLKQLAQVGLVATRREGNSIFYRRALPSPNNTQLQQALYAHIDALPLSDSVLNGLTAIRRQREQASQQFFNENSDKFRRQQDLIASFDVYAEQLQEVLQQCLPKQRRRAIEIGPGEGEFLSSLSTYFEEVIGIDNNQSMLERAANYVDTQKLNNITLHLADANTSQAQLSDADLVVANMVLHHLPSPSVIFQQAKQALNNGGALLITDLCLHDQNWVREACGDIWLGFEPEQLNKWAEDCGFFAGQSAYCALRNGFQIQIRHFQTSAN